LIQVERSTHCPLANLSLCAERERNLTEISLALVPDTVEKDTVGAV